MGLPDELPERRPATDAEARALASTLRLQILRLTLDESLTNKEIAERVGRNPATVLHHVRKLVDTGFLRAEEVRRGVRGAREVPYRATGKSWQLDVQGGGQALVQAFLTESEGVPPDQLETLRLGLRMGPEDEQEFWARMHSLLEDFRTRPLTPDARPLSVFLAVHPDLVRGG